MAKLENLHRLGFPGYFINYLSHIFSFRYKTCGLIHESAVEIRAKSKLGQSFEGLASEYGVSPSTITRIVNNPFAKDFFKLEPAINEDNHNQVQLCKNNIKINKLCGVLVLEAFVGPRPSPEHDCCHGKRGSLDDSLDNVYWGTKSQNNGADKFRDGTLLFGEKNHWAKLTNEDVIEIRRLYMIGYTQTELAKMFNITKSAIWRIVHGINWKYL